MFGELIVRNRMWDIPNVINVEEPWDTGLWVTFKNGFMVSIQWGFGMYCENRRDMKKKRLVSCDAEIAVFDPAKGFVPLMDNGYVDDIAGWVTPEEVKDLMYVVANLNSDDVFDKTQPLKFRDRKDN